jgi:hypothetical protein
MRRIAAPNDNGNSGNSIATPSRLHKRGRIVFSELRDEGRRSAQVFLETHASDLGRRSTLDLDVLLESI